MNNWNITENNASIVLIGEFVPEQFHPVWFIHKGIVSEWDYTKEAHTIHPNALQFNLPPACMTTITENSFSIQTGLESDFLTMRDITIASLQHCPTVTISQIGINYTATIHIASIEVWRLLGKQLTPHTYWQQAAPYLTNLDEEKQLSLGVVGLQMQLPRADNVAGYIYAQISVISPNERTFVFNINHHFEINDMQPAHGQRILNEHWEASINTAKDMINNIITNCLENQS